jgi:LPS O-antigen subunit length determinant protein (WzzB/FepE family)
MNEWQVMIKIMRDHGQFIICGMAIGAIITVLIILFQTPIYRVSMIVAPSERTGVPSLSSFLPKAAADAPALQYFVERIDASQSTDFTVFETRLTTISQLKALPDRIQKSINDDGDAVEWLQKNIKIRPVGMTPFRKISIDHENPDAAKDVLKTLCLNTDMAIRQDKKSKISRRISYLNEQLKTTMNPDHRDAIIALLKEQEQTLMMASIDNEFAAVIIEPPSVSARPISPRGIILFPVLMFTGMILGYMFSNFRQAIKR